MAIPPASAIVISALPYSQVVTAADFNAGTFSDGAVNEVWFKYVAGATNVFGHKSTDPFSSAFQSPLITLLATDGTTVLRNDTGADKGFNYGVTSGTTYYIRIRRNSGGGAADQDFTYTADKLDYLTSVAAGTVVINDDADPYPAIAFSIDGTFLGYISNIPAGEMGDALPNGISIWHNRFNVTNKFKLVARDLTTIAEFNIAGITGTGNFPRFGHSDTDFYVSDDLANSKIYKVTPTGTVTQVATLTGTYDSAYVIAVNADGTILYYINNASDNIIHQWDLVNDVALADLYTFTPGFYYFAKTPNGHPGDILRLSNGNLVTWQNNRSTGFDTLYIIDSTGTLVDSFSINTAYQVDHLAYNSGNPNSIILWLFTVADGYQTGVIGNYNLTTGTYTTSFTTALYSTFASESANGQIFGPSNSCTIVSILDAAPAGTGTLIINKVTVPSPDTTDTNFEFTTTGGLSPDTFNLKNAETQTYSNLVAGVYGVTEIVPPGWAVTYVVDNGDSPAEINIADGETVTIDITNTNINGTGALYKIQPLKRDDTLWESISPKRIKLTEIP
jgi:hypothetical protein